MKEKIAIFTGAGISVESGVESFRDKGDGLWYNYDVEEVATIEGWNKNPSKVLEFHNMLRDKLKLIEPNDAHKALKLLEEKFDVTIITQNVDDLHERAGSSNILHLHGELFKSRSVLDNETLYPCPDRLDIGDMCKLDGQLRPHTVLFGEYPYNIKEAYDAIDNCDYLLIIGTSLQISYTIPMLNVSGKDIEVYFIDPKPVHYLDQFGLAINYINKKAVKGVTDLVDKFLTGKITKIKI